MRQMGLPTLAGRWRANNRGGRIIDVRRPASVAMISVVFRVGVFLPSPSLRHVLAVKAALAGLGAGAAALTAARAPPAG